MEDRLLKHHSTDTHSPRVSLSSTFMGWGFHSSPQVSQGCLPILPSSSLSLPLHVLPGGNWYNLCLMRQELQGLHIGQRKTFEGSNRVEAPNCLRYSVLEVLPLEATAGIRVMVTGPWSAGSTGDSCISSLNGGTTCAESRLNSLGLIPR